MSLLAQKQLLAQTQRQCQWVGQLSAGMPTLCAADTFAKLCLGMCMNHLVAHNCIHRSWGMLYSVTPILHGLAVAAGDTNGRLHILDSRAPPPVGSAAAVQVHKKGSKVGRGF